MKAGANVTSPRRSLEEGAGANVIELDLHEFVARSAQPGDLRAGICHFLSGSARNAARRGSLHGYEVETMSKKDGSVAPKERINIKYIPNTGGQQAETELP